MEILNLLLQALIIVRTVIEIVKEFKKDPKE